MRRTAARRIASGAIAATTLLGAPVVRAEEPAPRPGEDASAGAQPRAVVEAPAPRRAPREVAWDPRWPRFRTAEYVATGLLAAGAFATLAIPPSTGRWTTVNGFDGSARDVLRIDSTRNREMSRDASDLLLTMMINHLATDALLVAWWWHGRGSVAWQLAMIDIEAIALNAAINGLVAGFASRERPYRAECAVPEARENRDCRENKRYRSFFSGHASTSFTAAGLICSHHGHLPLYGGGARDAFACGAALAAAATVATLRVTSDQHFFTDVLTGGAVGALTGFGLPWLLHYRGGAAPSSGAASSGFSIRLLPGPLGGTVAGSF